MGDSSHQGAGQEAPDQDHAEDGGQGLGCAKPEVAAFGLARSQQGHQSDQGNRDDVLKEEYGESGAAHRGGHQVALGHQLHGNRRRTHRQRQSGGNRGRPGQAEEEQAARQGKRAGQHLQGASTEHRTAHLPEAAQVEFEPDQKQHEHDAEFGKVHDGVDIAHQAQAVRTDRQTGDQIAQYCAEAEALGERHHDHCRGQRNQGVSKPVRVLSHGARSIRAIECASPVPRPRVPIGKASPPDARPEGATSSFRKSGRFARAGVEIRSWRGRVGRQSRSPRRARLSW